jgi:mannosyltransferase
MKIPDSHSSWEDSASRILIRLIFAFGIAGFVLALLFDVTANSFLLAAFRKIALGIGDAGRIRAAGTEKFDSELLYIIGRVKLFFPLLTALIFMWAWLWNKAFKSVDPGVSGYTAQTSSQRYSPPFAGLFFVMGLALCLRLILFNQSLFYDEIYTFFNFIGRANFLKSLTTYMDLNNHLLYSVLARGSIFMFGNNEWALRLPALIFGLAGIWALGRLAGLTGEKGIVWVSICLLIFSPAHIDFSQQARGYTALVFFSALSCYFFLLGLKEGDGRVWRKFMYVTLLGLCAQLYMFMVLLAEFFTVLVLAYAPGRAKTAKSFFLYSTLALLAAFLIYLPTLPYIGFEFFRDYPRQNLNAAFLVSLVKFIGSGEGGWDSGIASLLLFPAGTLFLWRRERAFAFLAVNLLLVPVALIALSRPVYLYPRFFIFLLPLYLAIIAGGVYGISGKIMPKHPGTIAAVITVFLVACSVPSLCTIFTKERQSFRRAASVIERVTRQDAPVIAPGLAGYEIAYYLKGRRVIKVKTLKEVDDLTGRYPGAAVLLTYLPTIEPEVAEFFRRNYRLLYYDNSRISSVMVYVPR